jgi:hypothetical protein
LTNAATTRAHSLETLQALDPEDDEYVDLRPQLYRAYAYAYAHQRNGGMRKMQKKLRAVDLRLLAGFMAKKTHPLLQKEAKKLLAQSGQIPRKMIVQRHRAFRGCCSRPASAS